MTAQYSCRSLTWSRQVNILAHNHIHFHINRKRTINTVTPSTRFCLDMHSMLGSLYEHGLVVSYACFSLGKDLSKWNVAELWKCYLHLLCSVKRLFSRAQDLQHEKQSEFSTFPFIFSSLVHSGRFVNVCEHYRRP